MTSRPYTIVLVAALGLGACSSDRTTDLSAEWPRERRMTMNRWMVGDLHDRHVAEAVVAQHTLYPHHFEANGAALNELGERDAGILAERYREHPGRLNVRRGAEPDALYAARVQTVRDRLTQHGVDIDRVNVADASAGGNGLVSERVLVILEEKMDQPLSEDRPVSGD